MGKKRLRRAKFSSFDRRSNSEEPSSSTTSERRTKSPRRNRIRSTILFLLFVVCPAISVILYRRISSPSQSVSETDLPDVYRRGLVKADVNYRQVLDEHVKVSANVSRRQFENSVLAYITPWNSKGYDLAKKFNSKLTHLSPVWYDLKSEGSSFVLDGRHNADIGWISEIRMNSNAKILPRVVLEAMPMDFLTKKKQRKKVINLIVEECKKFDYDGIVLESWSRWAAYGVLHKPEMRMMALQFIKQLGEAMHGVSTERNGESLQLVYVIGPPYSDQLQSHDFGPEDLLGLSSAVDGFSLMTYDFSTPHNPGPNAPLKWIQSTLKLLLGSDNSGQGLARKIFVGINFYGNDFLQSGEGGGPIVGREYLSLLEQHRPILQWEKNSAEHFFIYLDNRRIKHVVFYPTLLSIAMRLEEARSWGAGISIWEIGQGLDYFFDVL
ncbi:OLC1v1038403C1 [Oldenlandia corymbosa var. corymbosa]|uniref:Chitinase domain-containing protein 1 n=1 Tax=Oldenlandia corymbosa var. corymbosa TaxID=529605 RepID=A0AAV1CZT9_OLDCO|nr:OLC1v1038403C1 [Oldenlandia corymbosa var. corymbosa]